MSEGSQTRRGRQAIAWMVPTILLMAGCQQLPVPRPNNGATTETPLASTEASATGPQETSIPPPQPLPPLPPSLVETLVPPVASAPTPLLDEALARDKMANEIRLASFEETSEEPPRTAEATVVPPVSPPVQTPPPSAAPPAKEPAAPTESKPIDPEQPARPIDPREVWREGLDRLRNVARAQAALLSPESRGWSLRARLLESLAKGQDRDRPTIWEAVVTALGDVEEREGDGGRSQGPGIRAAVSALEEQAPLEIAELRLCRKVNGFGSYEPLDASTCVAGQPLIVYCELTGIRYTPSGELFRSRISSRVELLKSGESEPVWSQVLGEAEDLCRRRRRDYFVNYRITLPEHVPAGTYQLRLTQTDETAGRTTSASITLAIQP